MMERAKRILMTTAWYPNRKVAGDGVFINKHAQAVSSLNDVTVLMVQTDANVKGFHIDVDVTEGNVNEILVYVPRIDIEIPLLTGFARLIWFLVGAYKGYKRAKKIWHGNRPDVCHVNVLTRSGLLPWVLQKIHGIPYIITEHWTRYGRDEFPHGKLHLWITRRIVRGAFSVCPVSDNLKGNMLKWKLDNENYRLVGNVVDTDMFSMKPTCEMREKVRFIHVSWMRDDAKNISGILRVLDRLSRTRNDFDLIFVGDGVDRAMLYDMADGMGLLAKGVVSFVGQKQGADLVAELYRSDCLLMFSNFENQPVSILEALSCGLPVIATNVGAIEQMLGDGRGIVVAPRDEDGLYERVNDFITNHSQYISIDNATARRNYVVNGHSPHTISQKFDDLYNEALENL